MEQGQAKELAERVTQLERRIAQLDFFERRLSTIEVESEDLMAVLDTVAYLLERRIERALEVRRRAAS